MDYMQRKINNMSQLYNVQISELEKNLAIRAFVEFRNQMLADKKDHTMMDDLILKFIDASKAKGYHRYVKGQER